MYDHIDAYMTTLMMVVSSTMMIMIPSLGPTNPETA